MEIDTLLLAIVQDEDADGATRELNRAGFGVTQISSIGGLLEAGNVTLLVGLAFTDVNQAIAVLVRECHQRTVFVNAAAHAGIAPTTTYLAPIEANVGGAVIFTFRVERYIHLGTYYKIADTQHGMKEATMMKLLMAIVPEEISSRVLSALGAHGYRVTLISTTGGFLRRGNATLLIGIESDQVDNVLDTIRESCSGANSTDSCATIFVLGIEKYAQV